MPLWMRTTFRSGSAWGWAFSSVTPPCVAHRVCPIPTLPSRGVVSSFAFRLATLPTHFTMPRPSEPATAIPAESYPRYSKHSNPPTTTSTTRRGPV